jgi:T4 RnlA family RNA ligase
METNKMIKLLNKISNDYSMFFCKNQEIELSDGNKINAKIYSYYYFDPLEFEDCVNKYGAAVCRELRGITVIENNIFPSISKFFNLNENKFAKSFDELPDEVELYEKLDGSLISPAIIDNEIVLKSKASFHSEQARRANEITTPQQKEKIKELITKHQIYPQFEYVSPDNLIVVKYNKPELRLIAARVYNLNNNTFEYISDYKTLKEISQYLNLPLIKKYDPIPKQKLKEKIENDTGIEGWIIYWNQNEYPFVMSKVKTKWYLTLHKFSPENLNIKYVLEKIINEEMDDVLSSINEELFKQELMKKLSPVYERIEQDLKETESLLKEFNEIGIKEFGKKYGRKMGWFIGAARNHPNNPWKILKKKYELMLKNNNITQLKKYFNFS